jgi:hypothetical protein
MPAGISPALRLAIRVNAAGVRSTTRFDAQVPPQQARSPQNDRVRGPQSAIDVTTREPLHRFVVACRNPQVRRETPVTPQLSGRVIA